MMPYCNQRLCGSFHNKPKMDGGREAGGGVIGSSQVAARREQVTDAVQTGCPQFPQNFCPATSGEPHLLHEAVVKLEGGADCQTGGTPEAAAVTGV